MTATHRLIKRWCGDSVGLMGTGPIVTPEDRGEMTWNAIVAIRRSF